MTETLTFSQKHGYEAIPRPLQLEELPAPARTQIWNILYGHLDQSKHWNYNRYDIGDPWPSILKGLYVWHDVQPLDEWTEDLDFWRERLRRRVSRDSFNRVFDLIQFIMRHSDCPDSFVRLMHIAFESSQLAYTIDAGPPATIFPKTTPEEGRQLSRNLVELRAAGLEGCTAHLRHSAECISAKDWAGSIRDSIHAVESVAKQVDGAKTLGQALNSLEKRGVLQHKALREAFSKLYGYTSEEKGIRHALADESANVTIDEAVFFLGACASFASYLWRKHKAAGDIP